MFLSHLFLSFFHSFSFVENFKIFSCMINISYLIYSSIGDVLCYVCAVVSSFFSLLIYIYIPLCCTDNYHIPSTLYTRCITQFYLGHPLENRVVSDVVDYLRCFFFFCAFWPSDNCGLQCVRSTFSTRLS